MKKFLTVLENLSDLKGFKLLTHFVLVVVLIYLVFNLNIERKQAEIERLKATVVVDSLKTKVRLLMIEKEAFNEAYQLELERFNKENEELAKKIITIKLTTDSIKARKLESLYK
jgi:hypothetical protein